MRARVGARSRPTLGEVAGLAGVSIATVSRVVNGSAGVMPETRRAVEGAIASLGYVPNRSARSLVTRRTDTIGLVVSEPETRVFSDPFFPTIVHGISKAISGTELQLILLLAQGEVEQAKVGRFLRQGHVDGVILISVHADDPLPGLITTSSVPAVFFGRPAGNTGVPFVDADNREGALTATRYLLSSGRRKVATVTGRMDMTVAVDRLEGYRRALAESGQAPLTEDGDFSQAGGERATAALLDRHPDIDAVFAASDSMAIGALRAIRASGRRVPDDVAVIGFDDVPSAASTDPPLTTMRQPLEAMARAATGLLVGLIGGVVGEPVLFVTELIRRASA